MMKATVIQDHLGNVYKSISEMAKAYNQAVGTVTRRLREGKSVKEALLIKANSNTCYDHLGNEYESFSKMCKVYNQAINTVRGRLKSGMSLEEALTTKHYSKKKPGKTIYDHLGNEFESIEEMAEFHGAHAPTVRVRLNRGKSVEEALTNNNKMPSAVECIDYLGNKFPTKRAMAKSWNTSISTLDKRLSKGWTLEEALIIPHDYRIKYGNFLFTYNKEKYYKTSCPYCNEEHVFTKSEYRQHIVRHIKS